MLKQLQVLLLLYLAIPSQALAGSCSSSQLLKFWECLSFWLGPLVSNTLQSYILYSEMYIPSLDYHLNSTLLYLTSMDSLYLHKEQASWNIIFPEHSSWGASPKSSHFLISLESVTSPTFQETLESPLNILHWKPNTQYVKRILLTLPSKNCLPLLTVYSIVWFSTLSSLFSVNSNVHLTGFLLQLLSILYREAK